MFGDHHLDKQGKPELLACCTSSGAMRDPRARDGDNMQVFLFLEASKPGGCRYRLGLGCSVHPSLASMMAMLLRLF